MDNRSYQSTRLVIQHWNWKSLWKWNNNTVEKIGVNIVGHLRREAVNYFFDDSAVAGNSSYNARNRRRI